MNIWKEERGREDRAEVGGKKRRKRVKRDEGLEACESDVTWPWVGSQRYCAHQRFVFPLPEPLTDR